MRILVVEDDDLLGDGMRAGLTLAGFTVDLVATGEDAEVALRAGGVDAVVLDWMLPGMSGVELLAIVRRRGDRVPILILTARDRTGDKIAGLDAGADDYLAKPFDLDELAARLRALLRRASGRSETVLRWRGVSLDPGRMEAVSAAGTLFKLSRREFTVLHALMERPGTVLSKPQLEEKLYGFQEGAESNAVEVHIHHLRSKLGSDLIQTVRGAGYRLREEIGC